MAKSSPLAGLIGEPGEGEEMEAPGDAAMGDPVARKKRALRRFASAAGLKITNLDAAAEAFADAVDACLEYESPEV